jgi:hypothetical protein
LKSLDLVTALKCCLETNLLGMILSCRRIVPEMLLDLVTMLSNNSLLSSRITTTHQTSITRGVKQEARRGLLVEFAANQQPVFLAAFFISTIQSSTDTLHRERSFIACREESQRWFENLSCCLGKIKVDDASSLIRHCPNMVQHPGKKGT